MFLQLSDCAKRAALWALLGIASLSQAASAQSKQDVAIDYFGAERGYTVGGQPVVLLCVVRNRGKETLPANQLRLRLSAILGLDYTQGEFRPNLPEMSAGQSLSYRWIMSPLSLQSNLISGIVLEKPPAAQEAGAANPAPEPQMTLSLIPRFQNPPALLTPNAKPADPPRARTIGGWRIGNDKIGVQVQLTANRNPVLFLQGRFGQDWQTLAFSPLLAEVKAGEEGQVAWTEAFRVGNAVAANEPDSATLNLIGAVGKRWAAEMQFTLAPSTGAMQGKLRLTAKRTMRVFSVRLPALLGASEITLADSKADGKPLSVTPFAIPIEERTPVAALLIKNTVYGIAWTNTAPIPDWRWERTPIGDAIRAPLLGALWLAPERGDIISAGATLEFPFRLLAIGESQSAAAAAPFALP